MTEIRSSSDYRDSDLAAKVLLVLALVFIAIAWFVWGHVGPAGKMAFASISCLFFFAAVMSGSTGRSPEWNGIGTAGVSVAFFAFVFSCVYAVFPG